MKKGLTELVIIIDKSGSMSGLESDVVGGFNSLIEEQKKLEGEVLVTTIFFDSNKKTIFDRENIDNVKTLTSKDYRPSGCTALLDTLGNAITKINEAYSHLEEKDIPEHTIFSIMTDGLENSSTQYNYKQIKSLIEEKQKDGWSFLFQAANIDAIEWLNTDFVEKAFSEEEKERIVAHKGYGEIRRYGPTYLYFPSVDQYENLIENFNEEIVEETDLAKQMSKNTGYYDGNGYTLPREKEWLKVLTPYEIRGIRPAMDLYIDIDKKNK